MKTEYKGCTIELNGSHKFDVAGPGFDPTTPGFDSFAEAKAAIDTVEKIAAKSKKLSLEIMDKFGKDYVITGINIHTCNFTTKPTTQERYSGNDRDDGLPSDAYYPRVDKLKPLIARVKQLSRDLMAAQKQLETFQISYNRGRIDAANCLKKMNELVEYHESAKAAAEKL